MKLFDKKNKIKKDDIVRATLHLNMRLMPIDRGNLFEDPIDEVMHKYDIGEVTGGGTLISKEGMPTSSDIELNIKGEEIDNFISFLKRVNTMAKGSYLEYDGKKEEIGTLEGLNLILDGINLDEKVYKENDINDVIADIDNLLNDKGQYHSYYKGKEKTNLYFYGSSFAEMKKIVKTYTKSSPLCENSIIEKI